MQLVGVGVARLGSEAGAVVAAGAYDGEAEGREAALRQLECGVAADDAGLPDDPEFRSALLAYVEWGTRLAMSRRRKAAALAA